jgi:cytochrome c-type biogenesis protein CcmH/NrfG
VANTGRYDWRLPPDLIGSISIFVAATDRGGHRAESEAQTIELGPVNPPPKEAGPTSTGGGSATAGSDDALTGSQRARERAARLFAEAMTYRDRGELAEGVTRLREVVKLNPQLTDAFAEMAEMLYRLGDLDRALGAYDIALKQQPNSRDALRGAARVFQQKSDYPAAAERLRTVLRYNPTDAEVWLQLGDIAVFQGDEVRARECYTRATQIDPKASQVVADARQRLALMSEVSRDPTAKKR